MKATIGRIVHYALTDHDAAAINRRRGDALASDTGQTGRIIHVGNTVAAGLVFPAMVVRDWGASVNLQVYLDGNDIYWATSRSEGEGPGTWMWPPRVGEHNDPSLYRNPANAPD